jgi:type IV secretory pathway TraG/TraD family ATPase VirD4
MKEEMITKVLNSSKNLIVEGNVASGKTTKIMFPIVDNAINNKESLFILDCKEEYINRYYNELKANDYNIIVLNLRDMDKSEGWNPLEYPYKLYTEGEKDKAQEYLNKIGKTIFFERGIQDAFWESAAADFFVGMILGLFEDGKSNEINFNSVNNMFNYVDKRYGTSDYITEYIKLKDSTSLPYVYASATAFAPNETKGGIVTTAKQKLRVYVTREKLSKLLSKTTFDLDSILNKPTAIFFIAKDEDITFNQLAAMFIEQIYGKLLESKLNTRFNLILDNIDSIAMLNDLPFYLATGYSRNIKSYIATKFLTGLKEKYGEYMIRVCNVLTIDTNGITLISDGKEEKYDDIPDALLLSDNYAEYPTMPNEEVCIFNLEEYLKNNKVMELPPVINTDNSFETMEKPSKNVNIENLIAEIDKKIAIIDSELKEDNKKDNNSELEQFKIEE